MKKALFLILVIIISGLSGVIADRYVFPRLAATEFFNKYKILKKTTEGVTVINKTEQVYVKEETSLTRIANQISSSVVNIVSYPDLEAQPKNMATFKNGTGVIVTSDGIIMTYLDAINPENSRYKIMIHDGKNYDGELLAIDHFSNLVFIKINASNLPVISFGNSDDFKAGEKVIAIGNSLERYQNIYTSGVLNAFNPYYNLSGKTLSSSEKMEGIFETELEKEALCIGGPVIDYSGQVIGIMGSLEKNNKTDFFQIPGNKVKIVLDRVIKKEWDKTSFLGIYYTPITTSLSLVNDLPVEKGAMIYSPSGQQGLAIISNSPAARSGLKINDIITKINEEEITHEKSLSDIMYKYKKGDEIEMIIIREEKEMKIKIQL